MKKVLFFLFFGLLFSQQFAIGGIPIQIKKTNDVGEVRSASSDVTAEVKDDTVIILIDTDNGSAYITVDTPSGAYVASTFCPSTPGYAEIEISTPGCYVLTITTSEGIYQGQFIIN